MDKKRRRRKRPQIDPGEFMPKQIISDEDLESADEDLLTTSIVEEPPVRDTDDEQKKAVIAAFTTQPAEKDKKAPEEIAKKFDAITLKDDFLKADDFEQELKSVISVTSPLPAKKDLPKKEKEPEKKKEIKGSLDLESLLLSSTPSFAQLSLEGEKKETPPMEEPVIKKEEKPEIPQKLAPPPVKKESKPSLEIRTAKPKKDAFDDMFSMVEKEIQEDVFASLMIGTPKKETGKKEELLVELEEEPMEQAPSPPSAQFLQLPDGMMEEPFEEEKTEEPVAEIPPEEPIAKIPVPEEKAQEPIAKPPVPEEKAQEPIAEIPLEEPIAKIPVPEEKAEETIAEIPPEEPIAKIPLEEPIAESPLEEPIAESPLEEPIAESPLEEPIAEIPPEEPIAEIPVQEEKAEEPIVEIPPEEPIAKIPVHEEKAQEPIAEIPLEEPIAEIPVQEEKAEEPIVEIPLEEELIAEIPLEKEEVLPEEPVAEIPLEEPIAEIPLEEPAEEKKVREEVKIPYEIPLKKEGKKLPIPDNMEIIEERFYEELTGVKKEINVLLKRIYELETVREQLSSPGPELLAFIRRVKPHDVKEEAIKPLEETVPPAPSEEVPDLLDLGVFEVSVGESWAIKKEVDDLLAGIEKIPIEKEIGSFGRLVRSVPALSFLKPRLAEILGRGVMNHKVLLGLYRIASRFLKEEIAGLELKYNTVKGDYDRFKKKVKMLDSTVVTPYARPRTPLDAASYVPDPKLIQETEKYVGMMKKSPEAEPYTSMTPRPEKDRATLQAETYASMMQKQMEKEKAAVQSQVSEKELFLAKEESKKKDKIIKQLETQVEVLQRDFDNYKTRQTKEAERTANKGKEDLIKDLLKVVDDFERALQFAEESGDVFISRSFKMIYDEMKSIMGKNGLEEIPSEDVPFDPQVHECIMPDETDKYPEGHISGLIRRGYKFNGRLLRATQVKVATSPKTPPPQKNNGKETKSSGDMVYSGKKEDDITFEEKQESGGFELEAFFGKNRSKK